MHIKRKISKIIFDGNGKNTLRIEFLHICTYENITIQNNILHGFSIHHSIERQKPHYVREFLKKKKIAIIESNYSC